MTSILILIVVDINAQSGNSAPKNSTLGITSAISAIGNPFAIDNDMANLLINVLGNPFINYSQDNFPVNPIIPTINLFASSSTDFFASSSTDFFASSPTNFFAFSWKSFDNYRDPTFFQQTSCHTCFSSIVSTKF